MGLLLLLHDGAGPAPQYRKCSKCLPEFILPKIDEIFLFPGAIVSREMGIPAVVGTVDATRRIADGARVRVDGAAGTVDIL